MGQYHSALRQETADILAELPFFNGNVFNSRIPALRRDLLPCVRIYTSADQRDPISTLNGTTGYTGHCTLVVQVTAEAAADPAASDLVDLYVEACEVALMQRQSWQCFFELIERIETLYELDVQGETRVVTASLTFVGRYTDNGVTGIPVEPLPDLLRVGLLVDVIDPAADPNTTGHPTLPPDGYPGGYPGPDGRIEVGALIELLDEFIIAGKPDNARYASAASRSRGAAAPSRHNGV